MSAEQTYWVSNGEIVPSLDALGLEAWDDTALLERKSFVHLKIDEKGTTIRWSVFSANWSSLYFVMDWLMTSPGPITLEYFLVGWFSETYKDPFTARDRIHAVMAKSDVHLMSRTFVKSMKPTEATFIPDVLQDALNDEAVRPDRSIDCIYDASEGRYKVWRIGDQTPIAQLFGATPVAYPCVNGGSYDQIVSEIYPSVIRTGQPHYGHVYAAMSFPGSPPRWFPYQRVVLPHKFPDGAKGVTVVSQVADVDIKVV